MSHNKKGGKRRMLLTYRIGLDRLELQRPGTWPVKGNKSLVGRREVTFEVGGRLS